MKDVLHVAVGISGGFLRIAAALTSAQVGRVPVPPVMLGVSLLETVVVLRRLPKEISEACNI